MILLVRWAPRPGDFEAVMVVRTLPHVSFTLDADRLLLLLQRRPPPTSRDTRRC